MSKLEVQIIGGMYQHPSRPTNFQRCVNWYPTTAGPNIKQEASNPLNRGRNLATLMRTVGCTSIGTVNDAEINAACRGFYQIQISVGVYLTVVVMGINVYNLNYNADDGTITPTLLGALETTAGNVVITSNTTQIMFICYDMHNNMTGGSIYNYITNTFSHITDMDFLGGSHVIMIDGYFIYNEVGTANMLSSDVNNGLAWDATKIARAESNPDKIVGLGQTKGEMWVFGSNSIEVWYDAGNSPGFPFSKRVGSDIDIGCSAPYSIISVNGSLMWLDSRRFIVVSDYNDFFRSQSSGYDCTKLSTEAIDAEIASYATVSDCVATTYNDNGHIMAEFTFPSVNKTWVYDTSINMWHERNYHISANNFTYHALTNFHVQNEKYILGASLTNNKIYLVNRDYLDDDGEKIHRIRTTQHINADFKQIEIGEVEVKCNTGLANNITQYDLLLNTTVGSWTTSPAASEIVDIQSDQYELYGQINTISFDGTNYLITLSQTPSGISAGDLWCIFYMEPDFVYYRNQLTCAEIISIVGKNLVCGPTFIISSDVSDPHWVGHNSFCQPGFNDFSTDPIQLGTPNAIVENSNVFKVGDTVRVTLNDATTVDYDIENILVGNTVVPPSNPTPQYIPYNIGDSILNLDDSLINVLTIPATSVNILIGDIISLGLNTGGTFETTVASITGNDITLSDPLLSSKITIGNSITIRRLNPAHQNASIALRYSNDSGYTWSSTLSRSVGTLGQYGKRINWNCLGSNHEWIFEFKVTDPIDISIIDSYVDGFVGDI